jgi:tRNA(Ile)-lysidine synthase TilS/MesJ
VIRPLIECAEAEIVEHAREAAYPILPCNLCGSQDGLRREKMGRLLDELERDNPNVRAVMLNALRNVQPSHLLDPAVRRMPTIDDASHLATSPSDHASTGASSDHASLEAAPAQPGPAAAPVRRLPVIDAAGPLR